jgi:hypothetical protein
MEALKWFFVSSSKLDLLGIHIEAPPVVQLGVLALLIWSLVFAVNDAGRRGKSPFLALLFVLFAGWPLSLAWWLWLRPSGPPAPPRFPLPPQPPSR